MPPRGRKHWCKECKKSFPSYYSLGGHMNLHRDKRKQKKQARNTLNLRNISDGDVGYGLRVRERRHSTWLLCDSSDGEYLPMVPKTECQLCFKVFASCHALSMHMRVHARHEKKMVPKEALRESNEYCDHNVAVSAPVMLAYGIEEVNAARVLLKISGHSGMDSTTGHCNDDYEMDGNLAYSVQKNEMELDYSGQTGSADSMMESPSPDVKLKFSSLSQVLKATESHDCKLCGKVFTSSKGLASHKKFHKVDNRLPCFNLPGFIDRKYRSRGPKSAQTPWWTTRGFRTEGILDII